MAKTTPAKAGITQYEVGGWDPTRLDDVLGRVDEPHESYSEASAVDQLRAAIAADASRHGEWLQLRQYKPLPKRIAQNVAMSWRRANPAGFGGDRAFQARIMPLDENGSARRNLTITKQTTFAVAVCYPSMAG
ncbi:hypothetical protein [Agromyces sp. NPDC058126]|uniref:hypothetical protein n=1 Tax=Agromyces sp. NPDC058126 TaxID=3346350 RepID=UPI0036DEE355